jgi:fructose-1,6-bisphosphatase/inositol monophosphatase family enzyme
VNEGEERRRDARVEGIRVAHGRMRDAVVAACERQDAESLAAVAGDEPGGGDTIYAVDRISEDVLVAELDRAVPAEHPAVLIAEGLPADGVVLPRGADRKHAHVCIIVDPIDGTRGLMYQKRSAWILTGIGYGRGDRETLADIHAAVQTEIPLVKQHLCDTFWAVRGGGVQGVRTDRLTGRETPLRPRPSSAEVVAHGFATLARFFPGGRDLLAAVDDDMMRALVGADMTPGRALCFEDQYISTGGQLYELMMGHDRFVADLRPLLGPHLARAGWPAPLCCHPYDLCTALIAEEAGVVLTDDRGRPLSAPLRVDADVAWVGYANARLRELTEPALQQALKRHGLWRTP